MGDAGSKGGGDGGGLSGFEDRRLKRLLDRHGDADYELDLTGLDLAHAIGSVDRMVERQRFRDAGRSVLVRIDPATPDSGETHFGHLGRHLLDLKRRGLVATLAPLDPARGAGFNVTLPAGKETLAEPSSEGETLAELAPEGDDDDPPSA
ncbi:hypothetical protein [Pelagibius litoralis]|uniref:hypothetical protein n=1 Tax=Pelagibius litoralis TaxID=374515 RepID=UPI0019814DDD|nr:hypothetical protein [Pelagibius litoralis]